MRTASKNSPPIPPAHPSRLRFAGWLVWVLVANAALGWPASLSAALITVTNTADSGAGSLRQAIVDAQANDTIDFAPDVRGTIALMSGELLISKALTIQGPGADLLAIDAGDAPPTNLSRLLRIDAHGSAVSISGLTLTRGLVLMFFPEGGGIRNDSNLTLTACTVSACAIGGDFDSDAMGGGIFNATGSSIQLYGCTLQHNQVSGGGGFHGGAGGSGYGGALWNAEGATASLQNCTITGNTVAGAPGSCLLFCGPDGSGKGAGIYNAGDLVMAACTIASNTATAPVGSLIGGGGVWNLGNAQITDTLVAENTGGDSPDAGGAFDSRGFNLISESDGSAGFTAIGDQTGTIAAPLDPKLGPLQDNGGPTQTLALLPGSPAIDTGFSGDWSIDQRGYTRPAGTIAVDGGDGSDIGAFEVQVPAPPALGNLSTRALVETGDNVPIGGFIITGTDPMKVILRAIGPSLNLNGTPLPGRLANPTLELHGPGGLIASNDDWRSTQESEIVASGAPPTNDLESAIVATLPASPAGIAYTAVMSGANNTTGIGLVEVYDLGGLSDSKLANLSTRGFVQTGDDVMIGGFIVTGTGMQQVLVRALGPSVIPTGDLADPTLDLYDSNGQLLASNDNWRDTDEAEIIATGIPPGSDLEAAIVIALPPGGTTAIVRGKDGAIGMALVEVYALN
ncbi:MAG: choice-of-anchor Q domain-containing protein [Chthoniobacterales bacterium]